MLSSILHTFLIHFYLTVIPDILDYYFMVFLLHFLTLLISSLSLLLFRHFVNCVILVKLIKYWCHFYSYSCNVCPFSCTSSLVQNVLKNQPADVCPSETKTES